MVATGLICPPVKGAAIEIAKKLKQLMRKVQNGLGIRLDIGWRYSVTQIPYVRIRDPRVSNKMMLVRGFLNIGLIFMTFFLIVCRSGYETRDMRLRVIIIDIKSLLNQGEYLKLSSKIACFFDSSWELLFTYEPILIFVCLVYNSATIAYILSYLLCHFFQIPLWYFALSRCI